MTTNFFFMQLLHRGAEAPTSPVCRAYWHRTLGLKGFNEPYGRFRDAVRTARCGPARRVVWEGPG